MKLYAVLVAGETLRLNRDIVLDVLGQTIIATLAKEEAEKSVCQNSFSILRQHKKAIGTIIKEQVMSSQLEIIVQESQLDTTKAKFILDKFNNYFDIASEWEIKAKAIVVTDPKQTADMQMARVGRLFLREKRIAIEKTRKELKEQALREGKAIDGISNVLKALIVPIEEHLERQERFIEIQKEAELEQKRLEIERRMEADRIAKEKANEESKGLYD